MLSHFQKFFTKAIILKKINKREAAKGFYDYHTDKAIKVNGENLSIASANKYFKRLRFLLKEANLGLCGKPLFFIKECCLIGFVLSFHCKTYDSNESPLSIQSLRNKWQRAKLRNS